MTGPGASWTSNPQFGIRVGDQGRNNRLRIAAGGFVSSGPSVIGGSATGGNNEVEVSGPGSLWRNAGRIIVGSFGGGNQLAVTNGGVVISDGGTLSDNSGARSNLVVVTGPGSMWISDASVGLGRGDGNRLVISSGGVVRSSSGFVGVGPESSNGTVLVTGPGSEWSTDSSLALGASGSGHQLVVSNGGMVLVGFGLTLGSSISSNNSRIVIEGGTVRSTNSLGTSACDIRRGTNVLNAGLIEADRLLLTNVQGFFEFNGGTLGIGNSSIANGQPFGVGNGVSPATLRLTGDGSHAFGPGGVNVSSNGVLTGSGTASGALAIQPGGLLSPGTSIGRLALTRIIPPALQGTTLMEISKTGATLTNDVLQVPSVSLYGGSLIVSNAGLDALAAGDRFRLFVAGGYSGAFTNITLPPLNAGLAWRTNLLVDGSIEIVSLAPPGFSGVSLAGTNLVLAGTNGPANGAYTVLASTNLALPLSNWVSIATNQFDASGGFLFTNSIDPGIPQRFFQLEAR